MGEISDDSDQALRENKTFTFHVMNNDSVILIISTNYTIYFSGILDVEILHGSVDVMGCTLLLGHKYTVFSPKGSCVLNIHGSSFTQAKSECIKPADEMKLKLPEKVHPYFKKGNNILILKQSQQYKLFREYLSRYVELKLFPGYGDLSSDVEKHLLCQFKTTNNSINQFIESPAWKPIGNVISNYKGGTGNPLRIVLCGGSGVGKSTLLRVLINKSLNTHRNVLVLDFDPGQSEFTVMGCLSAILLDKPVFGPNYCHLRTPVYSLFLGDINIVNCIDLYIQSLLNIVQYCKSKPEFTEIPWIVNTMGFTAGLGVNIMSYVLRCVSPTDVVQINSFKETVNYPGILNQNFVNRYSSLLPDLKLKRDYTVHNVSCAYERSVSGSTNKLSTGSGVNAPLKRNIVTLSYFFSMFGPDDYYFTDIVPCRFQVQDVELVVNSLVNYNVSIEAKMKAMISNMVALCCKDENMLMHWLGYGIVRSVNVAEKLFYLITPLPEEKLTEINVIYQAVNICLPESVYLLQSRTIHGPIPYLHIGKINSNFLSKSLNRTFRQVPQTVKPEGSTSKKRRLTSDNSSNVAAD